MAQSPVCIPKKGGYVPGLFEDDLVSAVPAIKNIAQIQAEQISNIQSQDKTPEIWVCLATRVNELLAKPEIAGIIITHGTNTLIETAYFLDLTTTNTRPVILVGAQRRASDPDTDGLRNLHDAIRVALSPEAIAKGVLVVMNGRINAARDVAKRIPVRLRLFAAWTLGSSVWSMWRKYVSIAPCFDGIPSRFSPELSCPVWIS